VPAVSEDARGPVAAGGGAADLVAEDAAEVVNVPETALLRDVGDSLVGLAKEAARAFDAWAADFGAEGPTKDRPHLALERPARQRRRLADLVDLDRAAGVGLDVAQRPGDVFIRDGHGLGRPPGNDGLRRDHHGLGRPFLAAHPPAEERGRFVPQCLQRQGDARDRC
jgi:hypothetical protein